MKAIRSLIIDDERLAREAMRRELQVFPHVEIVGESGSLNDAKEKVRDLKPDVIFLDIEMPGGQGFDVLKACIPPSDVILVTAYEEYALKAYDFDVVDYLLKPVQPEKLKRALQRLEQRLAAPEDLSQNSPLTDQTSSARKLMPIQHGKLFLDPDQILAVVADGNYTRVILKGHKEEFVRRSMRDWEEIFEGSLFVRLDRKLIIQPSEVQQLTFQSHQARFILGDYAAPFEVGRKAATKLKQLFSIE